MFLARAIAASRRRIFDPLSLSPALWLDADDPDTLFTTATGSTKSGADGNVGRWEDKSGNNYHATRSTNLPIRKIAAENERDAVEFNGNNNYLEFTATGALDMFRDKSHGHVFIVCRDNNPRGQDAVHDVFSMFTSVSGALRYTLQTREGSAENSNRAFVRRLDNQGGASSSSGINSNSSNRVILSTISNWTAGTIQLLVNGSAQTSEALPSSGNTSDTRSSGFFIGGRGTVSGRSFPGTICEILAFNSQLASTEFQRVQSYLAFKYGIIEAMSAQQVADFYENRIVAAGSSISGNNKLAVKNFVQGCIDDGIWSAIKASCLLAGPDTLAGALVPLIGPAPTNFNFVTGDYNRVTGLVGNGSTKYLDSNRNNNADPQDSKHLFIHASEITASPQRFAGFVLSAGSSSIGIGSSPLQLQARSHTSTNYSLASLVASGSVGSSRSASSDFNFIHGSTVVSQSASSQNPASGSIHIFQANGFFANSRLSYYSIGESLDLALLDARITTYMASIS